MKTYEAEILREAFHRIIDKNKYVKFTVFVNRKSNRKPLKCKGKLSQLYCNDKGIIIEFSKIFINKKLWTLSTIAFPAKSIRWIDNIFNKEFIDYCDPMYY